MTVPVVTSIQNTADKTHFSGLKMIKSFYLPSNHHSNPPTPTREDVFTEEKSDIYVYVRLEITILSSLNFQQYLNFTIF